MTDSALELSRGVFGPRLASGDITIARRRPEHRQMHSAIDASTLTRGHHHVGAPDGLRISLTAKREISSRSSDPIETNLVVSLVCPSRFIL